MAAIVIVVAIPALLLMALAASIAASERRNLRILAAQACPSCGSTFGADAAREARDRHAQRCKDLMDANHDRFLRIAPHWPAVCPSCGQQTVFDSQERKLRPDRAD